MLGVLLPFAPAVPEPFYSALLPPLSTFSLFSFFLFFLSHLLSHSLPCFPPPFFLSFFFSFSSLLPPSLPLLPSASSPSSFSTLPPQLLLALLPPPLHFFILPSLRLSLSQCLAPASWFPLPQPPIPLCSMPGGPVPLIVGEQALPLPVLVLLLWGPFGGWGR